MHYYIENCSHYNNDEIITTNNEFFHLLRKFQLICLCGEG